MDSIRLFVTLNENYVPQLKVLLTSVAVSNPNETIDLYMMHSGIGEEKLDEIRRLCCRRGYGFYPITADPDIFKNAPVSKTYPREMYYRLLAPHLLPKEIDRVLYLDPDILVINPLRPLWEMDLKGNLFAAAAHSWASYLAANVSRVRLGTEGQYFNSGVLLMDLEAGRKEIRPEEIFSYTRKHGKELVLPDQDVLNAMYGNRILELDDYIWNYDARRYNSYLLLSSGAADLEWVIRNTAILHFCGRSKPWKPGYLYRFGVLYRHYMRLEEIWESGEESSSGISRRI